MHVIQQAKYYSFYTGCPRRNVQYFRRVFLELNYTDITQNTYIQSWTVTEITAREVWNFDICYTLYWLPNSYWNWLEYVVSVMLISVLNIKVTCEWHKAIKLNYKNSRIHVFAPLRLRSTVHRPPDRFLSCDVRATVLKTFRQGHCMKNIASRTAYNSWTPQQPTLFDGH